MFKTYRSENQMFFLFFNLLLMNLKGTYYGFLKIALHVVFNIDLSERKHPTKF